MTVTKTIDERTVGEHRGYVVEEGGPPTRPTLEPVPGEEDHGFQAMCSCGWEGEGYGGGGREAAIRDRDQHLASTKGEQ